jgi:hypothetical protein
MIKDPKSKMVYGRRRGGMDRRNPSELVLGNFAEGDSALREAAARRLVATLRERRLAGGELRQLELARLELAAWPSGASSTRGGFGLVFLLASAELGALVVLEVGVAVCDELWQVVVVLFDLLRAVELGRVALLLAGRHFVTLLFDESKVEITKRAGPIIAFWVRRK